MHPGGGALPARSSLWTGWLGDGAEDSQRRIVTKKDDGVGHDAERGLSARPVDEPGGNKQVFRSPGTIWRLMHVRCQAPGRERRQTQIISAARGTRVKL